MTIPTRTALLINSQSPGGSPLTGKADSLAMAALLKSPMGGRFQLHEIIMLDNPDRRLLLETIANIRSTYLLTHVAAHGFTWENGNRMICLQDGIIADFELLTDVPKQNIIIDSCWEVRRQPGKISGIPGMTEGTLNFDGHSWARQQFDDYILNGPDGKTIIYSTGHDQYAYEDLLRKGGKFTNALVDIVDWCQASGYEGFLSPEYLVEQAGAILQQAGIHQIPEIVYRSEGFSFPIALVSPRFIKKLTRSYHPELETSKKTDTVFWATVASTCFAAIALQKNT